MLEFTYYNTEKINDLKDFFTVVFVLINDVYNEIIPVSIKNRRNISDSKLSDSEIISISIVGEAKIIEIYNQEISQVMDAIQKLKLEIKTQKAEIETLSKENKLINKRFKSLEGQVNSNNTSKPLSTDGFKKKTKI